MPKPYFKGDALVVNIYEFKSNIGHYMKRLRYDPKVGSIVLRKYEKDVALMVPMTEDKPQLLNEPEKM